MTDHSLSKQRTPRVLRDGKIAFAIFLLSMFTLPHDNAFSDQGYSQQYTQQPAQQSTQEPTYRIETGPTIVAPGGLPARERAALRQEYTFQAQNKAIMLNPYDADETTPSAVDLAGETEGERYHRYFGMAIDLYKAGRLEEAAAILQYLSETDPQDGYVRSYLSRVQKEMAPKKARWKADAARDVAALKRWKVDTLVRNGVDSYKIDDFDGALTNFEEALSLEQGNPVARTYFKKLRAYYQKEIQADEALSRAEAKIPPKALSDADLKKKAFDKKVDDLLSEAEVGSKVDAIVEAGQAEKARRYKMDIGPGDVLLVSVLNHAEFSGEMKVQPSGEILLPLTGEAIKVKGSTTDEAREKITKVLDKYIVSPQVYVTVTAYKSKVFFVLDEATCHPYPITRSDLTLRDALFLSNWGNNRALGRVIVMRPSANHAPTIRKVDAYSLIYRGDLRHNIRIANGDVIYIPMSVGAKVTKTIYDTLAPFRAVMVARNEYLYEKWNKKDYWEFFRMPETPADMSGSAGGGGGYGDQGFGGYGAWMGGGVGGGSYFEYYSDYD